MGPEDDLQIVAVTLDPDHDTPEVLADYAAQAGAGARWHFARTETVADIDALALSAGLPVLREAEIAHGIRYLLLDAHGVLLARHDTHDFDLAPPKNGEGD